MINDIQRRILAEAAKFGGSNVSGAQIIANNLNEAQLQSWMSGGGVVGIAAANLGFSKAQFEGKMRQLLMKMGFEKGINKMDINGNKMVLYFANGAKANDFVITFNGLVKRSSKGSPATLSTSFDKIKSPAGTNAVVTVDFSMMKTEDLENGSDVFVMLEALYENSIEEAKKSTTYSVPAGASEKEFAKARAANPYKVRLQHPGKPAGAPANKVKEDIEESATKAALEDFMYDLPKAAIEELRPVMKMKQGVGRMAKITAVLKKHGVTQKLMGSYPAAVVNDYFDTFHGESVEESLAQPDEKVIGIFYEKTQNNVFEYRMSTDPWGKSHGLPHEVCVGPRNFVSGAKVNWRAANVKATVCYIAVDELEDGKPDIDKWNIKKHFKYVKAN
jgi:hypothetical protein